MRIRRNIIAPLILTIGAVGSLVAVPAVDRPDRRDPCHHSVAAGTASPDVIGHMGEILAPGQPPAVDSPNRLRAAGFRQERRKIRGKELTIFFARIRRRPCRRAPRGRFRHHRTVSQAVHVNRDIDQLLSMRTGITKSSVIDYQQSPVDTSEGRFCRGRRDVGDEITQSNILTTPCVHTVC